MKGNDRLYYNLDIHCENVGKQTGIYLEGKLDKTWHGLDMVSRFGACWGVAHVKTVW